MRQVSRAARSMSQPVTQGRHNASGIAATKAACSSPICSLIAPEGLFDGGMDMLLTGAAV